MPATIAEILHSRETEASTGSKCTLNYLIMDETSDTAAMTALVLVAPTAYGGLRLTRTRIVPTGPTTWNGIAEYEAEKNENKKPGDTSISFETGGGQGKLTYSRATISKTPAAGRTAPDFKGAIGVTEKGEIEGVEIVLPSFQFSVTIWKDAGDVDSAFIRSLADATGKTNNGTFRGFAAGEVLLLGCTGQQRNQEDWEITGRFSCQPNVLNLPVGEIVVPAKKGWEYVWVIFETTEDATAKKLVRRPLAAYVEQVYDEADFTALGF